MKDGVIIVCCCIVAFAFGMLIAIPTIVNLELRMSAIDYLNRH